MAKYSKQHTRARTKRKMFDFEIPTQKDGKSYVYAIARPGIQRGLQEALEAERDEIVGRSWHTHHAEGVALKYRNGYGEPRCLVCGSGQIEIRQPRLRQSYDSKIVTKYECLTPEVQQVRRSLPIFVFLSVIGYI